ncbi:hypothetical protein PCANB_002391 [Pneumocystis canis]|nr:hypothetical protein PCANB_002391 [Pneumocystis canis]
MIKKKNKAFFLQTNIPKLQNLIKRDPESYKEDFFIQWKHYQAMRDIFIENMGEKNENFSNLIIFISQVKMCPCYPRETENFPNDIATLLLNFQNDLHNETKEKIVQSLILLKNKNIISSNYLLKVIFPILSTSSTKSLNMRIFAAILSEIKNSNLKSHNKKINKMGKTILFEMIQKNKKDESSSSGIWAVRLCQELWKLKLWNDAFTVEIMKEAVLHSNTKIMIGGIHFFLNIYTSSDDSDNDDERNYQKNINDHNHKFSINKKSKKRKKQILKAIHMKKRKNRKEQKSHNFTAIQLLRDPQGFAEDLFSKYFSKKNTHLILKHKLLLLELLSKLIDIHKLNILGIYTFLLKYLNPNQKDITYFITYTAQACHDLIPPDDIEPIIEKIANEFINNTVTSEVICLGLNAIRNICSKQPLAMRQELLQSLSEYKKSKYKSIAIAARGLIGLYREISPELLKKKDRGRITSMSMSFEESLKFEEPNVQKNIEKLKLLGEWININNNIVSIKTKNNLNNPTKVGLPIYINNQKISKNSFQEISLKPGTNSLFNLETSMIFSLNFSKLEKLKTQKNMLIKKHQSLLKRKTAVEYSDTNSLEKYYKKNKKEHLKDIQENYKSENVYISRKEKQTKRNHSITNKKKSRKKNFMMLIHKKLVQKKSKQKLTNKRKILKKHITKKKKRY